VTVVTVVNLIFCKIFSSSQRLLQLGKTKKVEGFSPQVTKLHLKIDVLVESQGRARFWPQKQLSFRYPILR
jgi:hypothetical protein